MSITLKLALVGNPNVGKSTIFNSLTGLNQHTGNWHGKTVNVAVGYHNVKEKSYEIIDLPGTYSLNSDSPDEDVARDFIVNNNIDIVVVVADAYCLERSLNLFFQIQQIKTNIILCVNLIDQAEKKGLIIDIDKLQQFLKVKVVGISALYSNEIKKLSEAIFDFTPIIQKANNLYYNIEKQERIKYARNVVLNSVKKDLNIIPQKRIADKYITSKLFGIPIMLCFLGILFWLTIIGANYPSEALSKLFGMTKESAEKALIALSSPSWLKGILIDGIYCTLAWVIAVMMPPMTIFFPLFTFLEDLGYLPRVAFNLDNCFKKAAACGKQALTMCMGFGCNAVGVEATKIIKSPKQRLMAIVTNVFIPCNGRFPLLIAITSAFMGGKSKTKAVTIILAIVTLGIILTLLTSKILSLTLLKGEPETLILELPPYRKPKISNILTRSLLNKTLQILARAALVATPAGAILWIFANTHIGNNNIVTHCSMCLDGFAKIIGLDGYILLAFILALPANEIVLPIMIMSYTSSESMVEIKDLSALKNLLLSHGWTPLTAINVMLLSLAHFPCGTTLITINREIKNFTWTALAFIIPTIAGITLCFLSKQIFDLYLRLSAAQ